MLDPWPILRVLVLLGVANATPIFTKKLLKDKVAAPLDGGVILPDGQPLFGESKTVRGLLLSVIATALAAVLLGLHWDTGAVFAAASLGGDVISSFVKRRLKLRPHAQALGLDQIPEALLPMLLLRHTLNLSAADIAAAVCAFIVLALLLSRLLFKLNIRDRPY